MRDCVILNLSIEQRMYENRSHAENTVGGIILYDPFVYGICFKV